MSRESRIKRRMIRKEFLRMIYSLLRATKSERENIIEELLLNPYVHIFEILGMRDGLSHIDIQKRLCNFYDFCVSAQTIAKLLKELEKSKLVTCKQPNYTLFRGRPSRVCSLSEEGKHLWGEVSWRRKISGKVAEELSSICGSGGKRIDETTKYRVLVEKLLSDNMQCISREDLPLVKTLKEILETLKPTQYGFRFKRISSALKKNEIYIPATSIGYVKNVLGILIEYGVVDYRKEGKLRYRLTDKGRELLERLYNLV